MKEWLYLPVGFKKGGPIGNEVSDHRELGTGSNKDRFLDLGSAGQAHLPIDPHGVRATNRTPTGVAEREGSIMLILNRNQCLQEVHPFSGFYLSGFDPLRWTFLLMEPFDSQI